jgi:DNA-binding CsgD family transcriptional regulator/PAS domain-containing protein
VDERLSRLLGLLFEAPGDREVWWRFLEALAAEISPDVHVVALSERKTPSPSSRLWGARRESAVAALLPLRVGAGFTLPPLGVAFDVPELPKRLAQHPVVRGLLEPLGLLPGPGLGVMVDYGEHRPTGAILALPHREGWRPRPADRELFDQLAPFLLRVTRLHERVLDTGALTSILDHLVLGVILLDDRARVTYMNQSAAELMGVEPGLTEPDGPTPDPRTRALYGRVRPVESRAVYERPEDGRTYNILSAKLEWPSWQGYPSRRFARALFVGDPSLGSGDPYGNLNRLYGLTESEAQLAMLLVGDFTLLQAAKQLQITESTARTVLKRILAKTGTRRQASLVRLLLSGPGQIREREPSPGRPPRGMRRRRGDSAPDPRFGG